MIARPKISRNEWKTTEIGAFEVGNFAAQVDAARMTGKENVTALSIMRLLSPPGKVAGGSIHFEGTDLLAISEEEMRKVRGNEIAMI